MSTNADMDTTRIGRRNRSWPEALKREIVAASLAPEASVSKVARHYDVNVNQVFKWRKLYRDDVGAPAVGGDRRDAIVGEDRGIIDEDADGAQGFTGIIDETACLAHVAEIGLNRYGTNTQGPQFSRQGRGILA